MTSASLTSKDLKVIIGDNAAEGSHRGGYNGIWELTHRLCSRPVFVPYLAGLNLEHIFSGENDESDDIFFEPRKAPMILNRVDDGLIELYQPATPTWKLESWSRFSLQASDCIKLEVRARATQHTFPHNYIGLFWASYINAPEDKSFYFWGGPVQSTPGKAWVQFCTQIHGRDATVVARDAQEKTFYADNRRHALYKSLSKIRYDEPWFYGRFENLALIFVFPRAKGVRFSHSPTGGGYHPELRTHNPAWDFQQIIQPYEIGQYYEFVMYLIITPYEGRAAIVEKCHQLLNHLG